MTIKAMEFEVIPAYHHYEDNTGKYTYCFFEDINCSGWRASWGQHPYVQENELEYGDYESKILKTEAEAVEWLQAIRMKRSRYGY